MSLIKTPEEIKKLEQGGEILSRALKAAMSACRAGASTKEVDDAALDVLKSSGAKPSFLGYTIGDEPPFPSTVCISINEEVVHGSAVPPRTIKDGDIVSLDIGCWYQGLCTDMATTVMVGRQDPKAAGLVKDTRQSLVLSLEVVKEGGLISDIGSTVQDYLEPKGYGIVRELVGHGVGNAVHEEPQIPNFRDPRVPKTKMRTGMVLAIEPMVTLGDWHVTVKEDGWTIVTSDKSLSAHFEVTVAVTEKGYKLLTPWPDI